MGVRSTPAAQTAPVSPTDAAVAIGLGVWRFERYKAKKGKAGPRILWPEGADRARASAMIQSICLARDLITTPSSDMGPAELAAAVMKHAYSDFDRPQYFEPLNEPHGASKGGPN